MDPFQQTIYELALATAGQLTTDELRITLKDTLPQMKAILDSQKAQEDAPPPAEDAPPPRAY